MGYNPPPSASAGAAQANAEAYADTKDAVIVGGAPVALDTLKELADAIGDDPTFAQHVVAVKEAPLLPDRYGVKADGVTDDTAAWSAAMAAMPASGGEVMFPASGLASLVSAPIELPNKVSIRGMSRSGSIIKARAGGAGFAGSGVVRLGKSTDNLVFGCRLENLTVDASGIAQDGVYSNAAQEQSGLFRAVVADATRYSINLDTSGVADCSIDDVEMYPHAAATYGIYNNACGGRMLYSRVTVVGSGSLTAGIYVRNSHATVLSSHFETATDGVVFDGSDGAVIGATGPSGGASVTSIVHMLGNARYVFLAAITKASATNAFKDDFFGKTCTDPFVQAATLGDHYVARLDHYGDKIGFFGTAAANRQAVAGAKGGNAALASLLTALATYGIITDNTTA